MKALKSTLMVATAALLLGLVGTATSALAISFGGPSISIAGAQYNFGGKTGDNLFQTATGPTLGPTDIIYSISKSDNTFVLASFGKLVVTPVNFAGGFNAGTGGGFSIYDSGGPTLLLSGTFGPSTLSSSNNTEFEASAIVTFVNQAVTTGLLGGETFNIPGKFSATLGDIGTLTPGGKWTTNHSATAQIESSVPEPLSLLLLGSGLVGLGLVRRKIARG